MERYQEYDHPPAFCLLNTTQMTPTNTRPQGNPGVQPYAKGV